MEDSATKRARWAVGTMCKACGKHFSTSHGYDQHWRHRYLCGTACHEGDDGTNRSQMVATTRANMSITLLQKLKLSKARKSSRGYTFQNTYWT